LSSNRWQTTDRDGNDSRLFPIPEQLEGEEEADPRTDIFAFGVILYEMATGQKAFSGKSQASLISAVMSSDPTPSLLSGR